MCNKNIYLGIYPAYQILFRQALFMVVLRVRPMKTTCPDRSWGCPGGEEGCFDQHCVHPVFSLSSLQ
jgi:hypothetical protein